MNELLNKPTTAVYSTRADIRTISALAEYFIEQGVQPRSISELHRLAIEAFAQMLINHGIVKEQTSTNDAKNYLEKVGLFTTLSPRNRSTLLKQIQKETLISEGIDPSYVQKKGQRTMAEDQFEKAKELLNEKVEEKSGQILGPNLGEIKE